MVKLINKQKSKKDPNLFSYKNAKGEKLWGFRYRYYNTLGLRKEASRQGYSSEKTAMQALLELKTNIVNGDVKKVDNANITVGEWLDIWYETNKVHWKVSTIAQRNGMIRLQMKPLLGRFKLQQLERSTYVRSFINKLLESYEVSSVITFHRVFKVAINAAVEEGILARNRFTKIKIEDKKLDVEKSINYYDSDQLNLFLEASRKYMTTTLFNLVNLVAYSGIRRGEALGIQWKSIDFDKCTITIRRTRDNKGVRSPKTKNSYRTIPIDKEVIEELRLYRTWTKRKCLEFGRNWSDEDLVFISHRTAEGISDSALFYAFKRVHNQTGLPKVTVHGLRHTHATLLMLNPTVNVKTIADRLGNTVDMINRIYGHVLEEMEFETANTFSLIMNQSKQRLIDAN